MTNYSFIRYDHETGNLEQIGNYPDRKAAEHRGHQEMISSLRIGGAIIETAEREDEHGIRRPAPRVVSVAPAGTFINFDDSYHDILTWWRRLSPATKGEFATRTLNLKGPARADVGDRALCWVSINHGPYQVELSHPYSEFADAIVGHEAEWLEGTHPSWLE